MQIALFGGRFDPVHNGHVAIAQEVLKSAPTVDEVWMVPDNHHHWNPTVASFEDRLAMLKLIENDPSLNSKDRIKASDIGFRVSKKRNGMTATIDIIRELQSPSAGSGQAKNTYLFIAGSDQLPRLHEWTDYEELKMRLPFLIFPRIGYTLNGDLPEGCLWLSDKQYEPMDNSATEVRKRLAEGKSIADFVPKKVEEYIKEHNLYV